MIIKLLLKDIPDLNSLPLAKIILDDTDNVGEVCDKAELLLLMAIISQYFEDKKINENNIFGAEISVKRSCNPEDIQ